ncbi:hypothetical protein AMATHDRAFT_70769 [Amanita thiersii Skay4041]|uniref:Enoyl-CoA hydratase n=1 Tax=Amanita thiersii Skay4041 TaxID=703135 RepID=A0A2A9NE38_9AGAR|nr:hypothetical protein AMATHDRAFT_70769 [Amanita thiersii Skay4041]
MAQFSTANIKVSEPFPHVIQVDLARKPGNAFSTAYWTEYRAVLERIRDEGEDVRVVVVSSAFPKVFSAGLDLSDKTSIPEQKPGVDVARTTRSIRQWLLDFQTAIGTPERCPFPVIAACHGHVVGLGVDLAAACDIRYAATNSSFCIKEVDVGLAADIGALAYLPRITGNMSQVYELAYTARPFGAQEAEKLGLVSKVVEGGRNEVVAAALELAKTIARMSPLAISGTKTILLHSRDHTVQSNLEYTATWNGANLLTHDLHENIRALKTKTPAKFGPVKIPVAKL